MTFDPYNPVDLSSEEVFGPAVAAMGGTRPAALLGQNLNHKNADWVFPEKQFIVEHKQLEASFTQSEAFIPRQKRNDHDSASTSRRGQGLATSGNHGCVTPAFIYYRASNKGAWG
jgi:hypothetical protein